MHESEKQRRRRDRQIEWDRRHLRTVSTHLTRMEADALDVVCRMNRTTKYNLLHDFLIDYLKENGVPVRHLKYSRTRF